MHFKLPFYNFMYTILAFLGHFFKTKGSGQNYFTCSGPTFWRGGWARDHGSVQTGEGGMDKRPWVCTDRWGGWARDHGSVQTGGGMGKRPWVCADRWGDGGGGWARDHGSVQTGGGVGQETMGLYRQVGGWVRDHGSVQTGGGGDGQETMGLYRQVGGGGGVDKRPWVCTDRWGDG